MRLYTLTQSLFNLRTFIYTLRDLMNLDNMKSNDALSSTGYTNGNTVKLENGTS